MSFVPSRGVSGICAARDAKRTHCSCATLSRSVKYTWPDDPDVACATSPSTQRSLNASVGWTCEASWTATCPTRRARVGAGGRSPPASGALDVLTAPRVDLDLVAPLDEQRHVHAQAGLERRRLRRAGRGVSLEPEVGVLHGEDDRRGQVDADGITLVLVEHHGHPVAEIAHGVGELIGFEGELVVRRRVHEVVLRPVVVHVLDVPVVQARALEAVAGLERLLDEVALTDVAQLHTHLRAAAPELDVLELDDLVERAVELDGHAPLDLAGRYHPFSFGAEPSDAVSSMSQRRASS